MDHSSGAAGIQIGAGQQTRAERIPGVYCHIVCICPLQIETPKFLS